MTQTPILQHMIKISILSFSFSLLTLVLCAQNQEDKELKILRSFQQGTFPIVLEKSASPILIDTTDAYVVGIVAHSVASDIGMVSGVKPEVISSPKKNGDYLIMVGTIGHSIYIDRLIKNRKIDVSNIQSRWESFVIATVNSPMRGVKQALVVAGSDRRGTAYGLFELSRRIGVSPWLWWADVVPEKSTTLCVVPGTVVMGEPSVKYRGIFLNDEDWGLKPWAAKNMDTDIKDIGPKTYASIFELLLRLRANFIWPAMHDCTRAFYYYPENPKVADDYAIVVGSSHCEPMLRNNVFEWNVNFVNEYGVKPSEWRYDTNKKQIYTYWNDRIKRSAKYESVYTIGMRGIHDSSIPGPRDRSAKIALMDSVIKDQRQIFKHYFNKVTEVPQIFCPYKEVLDLYQNGLKLPDDVTIVWADDNHGYIRQLSTPEEQQRSGGSGVYYHLSYWGTPHDYLWLSTISPSLISYEMTKALQFGANRLWVVNVGDIKPAEMETEFFLDMAWDAKKWTPDNAHNYSLYWAEETFGEELASEIAAIKNEYLQLAQNGKPEHLRMIHFSKAIKEERVSAYLNLVAKVDKLKIKIPKQLQSAFFQLVEYPVKGAALMNQKILYAQMSMEMIQAGDTLAFEYSQKAQTAFDAIQELTRIYNVDIENGKWNGMMSAAPRNMTVFAKPVVATSEMLVDSSIIIRENSVKDKYTDHIKGASVNEQSDNCLLSVNASSFKVKHERDGEKILIIKGLGLGGESITRYPFTGLSGSVDDLSKISYVEYSANLKAGRYNLSLKCLPTQRIHQERSLRMALSVNGQLPVIVDVDNSKESVWRVNVIRGYSEAVVPISVDGYGETLLRVYLLDTGLSLSRIDFFKE